MSESPDRDSSPLPDSVGNPGGAPLPDGSPVSPASAWKGFSIVPVAGPGEDEPEDEVHAGDDSATLVPQEGLPALDDGQGANIAGGLSGEERAVTSGRAALAGANVALGSAGETVGVPRPPIRPVGYQRPAQATVLLVLVTLVQIAWFGFAAYYFLDLSRHDWVEQLNPFDDHNIAAMSENQWLLELDMPELAGEKALYEAAKARRARFEQFDEDQRWLVPTFIGLYWLELAAFAWWQLRVHRNAPALGTAGMRGDPLTSLVWWIVPIVNWWLPLGVMQEIWRGSDPSVPAGDGQAWRLKRASALAGAWRVAAVLAKLTGWLCLFMVALRLYSLANPPTLLVAASGLMIVAGVLQIALVRKLGARQESLYRKRTKAAEKAIAAGLPVVEAQVIEDE